MNNIEKCLNTAVNKQVAKATVVPGMELKDLSQEHLYELLTNHPETILAQTFPQQGGAMSETRCSCCYDQAELLPLQL